jgi:hypothetical protein
MQVPAEEGRSVLIEAVSRLAEKSGKRCFFLRPPHFYPREKKTSSGGIDACFLRIVRDPKPRLTSGFIAGASRCFLGQMCFWNTGFAQNRPE